MIREIAYVRPDDRREIKAARYLNWRINRQVNAEDTELIARVQAGMASSSYEPGRSGQPKCACGVRAQAPYACAGGPYETAASGGLEPQRSVIKT